MNISKKITALFLLCIFLFNTIGYFIAFKVTQYQIKSEVFAEIKSGIMPAETIITIDKRDLSKIVWQDDGREILYNGKRLDVVKSKQDNTSITYYCFNDKQEESLFASLDNHINTHIISGKPLSRTSSKNLVNDVIKIFFSNHHEFNYSSIGTSISFFPANKHYISASLSITSPPPRIA